MTVEERSAGSIVARVGGALALIAATLFVLQPFLVPMAWAAILAYVSWPVYRAVRRVTGRPHLAAGALTLAAALLLGIPVASMLVALAQEATHLVSLARDWVAQGAPLPAWVEARPWLATRLDALRSDLSVDPKVIADYVTRYGSQVSGHLVDVAGGIASNAFKFAITLVTTYVFYIDGERLLMHARRLAPIVFPSAGAEFLEHVGRVVRAVVFGLLGTAMVQGTMAGIGFAVFGVPSPVALGVGTFVLSFIPVGPPLLWGGAAVWLFVQGLHGNAIGMAIWGLLFVSSVDNVLRPLLISSGPAPIPFLLVFLGVLGGLSAFGMLGLFLGPVLLSVSFALLAEFPLRRAGGGGPAAAA